MVITQIHRQNQLSNKGGGGGGGGHEGLRYCGIGIFFKRYFSNFDFNVWFLLTVFGRRRSFTVLPAVPFICMHSTV